MGSGTPHNQDAEFLAADVWKGRKAMEAVYGWSLSDDAAWTFLRAAIESRNERSVAQSSVPGSSHAE